MDLPGKCILILKNTGAGGCKGPKEDRWEAKGTILILRQQKDWVGGLKKKAIFADVQYCFYPHIVGGWVWKSPKMCWRNIGMVPKLLLANSPGLEIILGLVSENIAQKYKKKPKSTMLHTFPFKYRIQGF